MSVGQWASNFGGKDCPSPGYLWGHLTSKAKVGLEKDSPPQENSCEHGGASRNTHSMAGPMNHVRLASLE